MWEIDNSTPFDAAYSWVRNRDGADCWLVAVRGTFFIHSDGSTTIADEQSPVSVVPKYLGELGRSSLIYESDLLPTKPTTDVTLLGSAYAPAGNPATSVDVTLNVGSIVKTLRVFGDRSWMSGVLGPSLTEPKPFEKMPLVYERAFGGSDTVANPTNPNWDTRNPVGCGFASDVRNLGSIRLPNIEDPRELITSPRQRPSPAGFGPIAAYWASRSQWGGTYDEKWEKERQPLVPDDFDDRFYLTSPADQQPSTYLRGGEPVELRNLTSQGYLRFQLPRVVLGFETYFYTNDVVRHRPILASVILEPDVPRVMMVWQTSLECHSRALKLDRTRIIAKEQRQRFVA